MLNKESLLSLGIIADNNFLDLYVELINNNENSPKIKFKTNAHHIIPKCYYKMENIPIDNSKSNIVNLSIKEHILAHYYLVRCSCNERFTLDNLYSIRYLFNYSHNKLNITDLENIIPNIEKNLDFKNYDIQYHFPNRNGTNNNFYGKHHSEESKIKISKSKMNPSIETRQRLSDSHKGIKPSNETVQKRSISIKLAHQSSKNYLEVGEKISLTKKLLESGNNRKGKIHLKHPISKKSKYVKSEEVSNFINLGYMHIEDYKIYEKELKSSQDKKTYKYSIDGIKLCSINEVINYLKTEGYYLDYKAFKKILLGTTIKYKSLINRVKVI